MPGVTVGTVRWGARGPPGDRLSCAGCNPPRPEGFKSRPEALAEPSLPAERPELGRLGDYVRETVTLSPGCGYGVLIIAGLLLCVILTLRHVARLPHFWENRHLYLHWLLRGTRIWHITQYPVWGFCFTRYMFSFKL